MTGTKTLQSAYDNNENGKRGYYPIGTGNFWHAGIHLNTADKSIIKPVINGKAAAYRIRKEYKKAPNPKQLIEREFQQLPADEKKKYSWSITNCCRIYTLRSDLQEQEKYMKISDCFILLKHTVAAPYLMSGKQIFYTLYMNLAPLKDAADGAYDKRFICDGVVHILNDEQIFIPETLGSAGVDNADRYIDFAVMTEKDLFAERQKPEISSNPKTMLLKKLTDTAAYYSGIKKSSEKPKEPEQYIFTEINVLQEEKAQFCDLEKRRYYDEKGGIFRKIQNKEIYITDSDAKKSSVDAFEWKEWFTDTNGKTGGSTGILCDRNEVLKREYVKITE